MEETPAFCFEHYLQINRSENVAGNFSEVHDLCIEEESGDGENVMNSASQENKENTFTWNNSSTLFFIDEYEKRLNDFRNPKKKKKMLWDAISNEMVRNGYSVDGNILDRKMRNMKYTFNKIKDNNNKKKTGRGRVTWEYYDRFCQIFKEDRTINTSNLISSFASGSDVLEPTCSSSNTEMQNTSDVSENSLSETPTPSNTRKKQKKLDTYRQRLLAIEEERVVELKQIRLAVEENNKINQEKVNVLKQFLNER